MKKISLFILLLVCGAAFAAKDKPLLKDGEPFYEFVPHQLLVKFFDETPVSDRMNLAKTVGGKFTYESSQLGYYLVELNVSLYEAEALAQFRSSKLVEWANFNYIAHAAFTPNDQYYTYQWHYPRINLPQAWDITRGSANVVVAVCDQGWQFNHEDWSGVQTVSGYDFVENDNDPSSPGLNDSHGMHVAGTILCASNNTTGVASIAPLCRFMPIKVLNDEQGSGTIQQISDGIAWAGDHNADVLNLSLGFTVQEGVPPQDPGPPLSTAINNTASQGTVIFAATGNDAQPYVAYPGAYDACIAVGATTYNDAIAPYSNQGTAVDITAPGGNTSEDLNNDGYVDGVLSTVTQNGQAAYVFFQGTSMATPHACGVGALLISNGLAGNQVRTALQSTAIDLGANGRDNVFGYGRIDAFAALNWQGGGGGGALLDEPFEVFPLEGWEAVRNEGQGVGWQTLNNSQADCGNTPHGGNNGVWHDDEAGVGHQDDWLISPLIAIPAGSTEVVLTFWQRNCYVTPQYYEYHGLLYTTDGTNYTEVIQFNESRSEWTEVEVDATTLAGSSVRFAWRYQGTYATEWFIDDVRLTASALSADKPRISIPKTFTLLDPYPNPFNSIAQIEFELSATAKVELAVYNLLGQKVASLLNDAPLSAGKHHLSWDARTAASGLYLIKLQNGSRVETKKLMLLK